MQTQTTNISTALKENQIQNEIKYSVWRMFKDLPPTHKENNEIEETIVSGVHIRNYQTTSSRKHKKFRVF